MAGINGRKMKIKQKHYNIVYFTCCKLSRRLKKKFLGTKLSKKKLRELLASVKIIKNEYPTPATILPFEFCPKCGCKVSVSTSNMVGYPEVYSLDYCRRCGYLVGAADNSPYYHCLEGPNYELP
jgi:hypothetical protein